MDDIDDILDKLEEDEERRASPTTERGSLPQSSEELSRTSLVREEEGSLTNGFHHHNHPEKESLLELDSELRSRTAEENDNLLPTFDDRHLEVGEEVDTTVTACINPIRTREWGNDFRSDPVAGLPVSYTAKANTTVLDDVHDTVSSVDVAADDSLLLIPDIPSPQSDQEQPEQQPEIVFVADLTNHLADDDNVSSPGVETDRSVSHVASVTNSASGTDLSPEHPSEIAVGASLEPFPEQLEAPLLTSAEFIFSTSESPEPVADVSRTEHSPSPQETEDAPTPYTGRGAASLNSLHSNPVAIPSRKTAGFDEDVRDTELEEFLSTLGETEGTSLSAELQLIPAGNFFPDHQPADHPENGFDISNTIPWSEDDSTELRASPPLEMAPPIPMTLVDVTDFFAQEALIQSPTMETQPDGTAADAPGSVEGDSSEATSTSEEALIQLSTDGSQDTNPGPSDYLIALEAEAGGEDSSAEGGLRSATSSFVSDENSVPAVAPAVIFSVDNLGKVRPEWVPDEFAPICMLCGTRFSMVKRRHHCRACGSVICASCGNFKAKLEYLEMREDRVCAMCNETFQYRNGGEPLPGRGEDVDPTDARSPSPVVISSFTGAVPPGVLRRLGDQRRERRNVVFFDGIRPGGDLMEPAFHGNGRRLAVMNAKRQRRSPAPDPPKSRSPPKKSSANHTVKLFVNRDVLPVMEMTRDGHYILHETPDLQGLVTKFSTCPSEPVDFYVNSCLRITVQIVELKCCMNVVVWSFVTSGMRLVGQDEVVILLVKEDENDPLPPRDMFLHLNEVFLHAKQGQIIGNLGHSIVALGGYDLGFLGNRHNAGFLFIRQSYQCVNSLRLPEPPYLFGVLMNKWEIPWAKMFPLRLMLRLGTEYRYYPCPLISYRNRKPVFEEVGHTVMNLLCDFRNFQYHLPCVEDTECCMEKGFITVRFPRHRYDQIVKVCQGSNEHVLAIGLGFAKRADAHLVCVQNFENGQYETKAINIDGQGRKVTGTSFIIFNASLKGSDPLECRAAVVEDGIMAQINVRGLENLKEALKSMRSISFKSYRKTEDEGSPPVEQETILIEWTDDPKTCNAGVKSPIDGKDMIGVESRRVSLKHSMDFLNGTLAVRCTEVFLTDEKDGVALYRAEIDVSRLAENLAMASCAVLRGHLYDYRDAGTTKIALRVSLGPDIVEYEVGAKGERFPPQAMTEFDDKIMPLIYECARVWGARPRLEMELIFRIFQH
ncbi:Zinc finger FYVE domain-containing protein 9 [Hypsibius exemplaris]|uniref:Zinc finger FYVE domain-containing protein 9 n=1 Tax=Hypsibius exemplaris TaxID=2072580 RepID=A0A1W0X0Z6_HYPEX|nr:Zinc finger FYVE domain-containing protein 9 [Hypsibius exemplaris]